MVEPLSRTLMFAAVSVGAYCCITASSPAISLELHEPPPAPAQVAFRPAAAPPTWEQGVPRVEGLGLLTKQSGTDAV